MLQALNLDSASSPAMNRKRESDTDLQGSAFASYLASAAQFTKLATSTTATSSLLRRETETRPRASSAKPQATPETGTTASDRVAEAPPKAQEGPQSQEPTQKAEDPQKPDKSEEPQRAPEGAEDAPQAQEPKGSSPKTEAAPSPAQSPAPTPTAPLPATTLPAAIFASAVPAPPATPTPSEASPVQATGRQTSGLDAQNSMLVSQSAADATPLASSKAQTAQEQAPLHFRIQEETPGTTTSKPALTELLSLPRPEMEIPEPLMNASRAQEAAGKDLPTPPAKAAEAPVLQLPTLVTTAALNAEAVLAVSPKTETPATKPSTPSNVSIATGGPAASVKGTTPVPALEGAQSPKANATFEQVDGSIRWLIQNHEKGAEIQLNPESLGRVVIKLRMEGGEVHAKLWASEASTVPILQDQKAALEASLRQQGLTLGSFDLQQGRRGDDAQSSSHTQALGSGAGIAGSQEKKQDLPTVAPALLGGAHLIELFA